MGRISSLGDFVGITLVWYQPVFWMLFYHWKTIKFDRLLNWQFLGLGGIYLMEMVPFTRNIIVKSFNSHRLLVMYLTLGTIFTWFLMKYRDWHYPQAVSIAFIVIFIGSFYWEIPYLIRNAFITGPEPDWLLHWLFVFPIWYIHKTIGWKRDVKTVFLVLSGLIVSIVYMKLNPIPYVRGGGGAEVWDTWYYLSNRVICIGMLFGTVNKE